MSLPPGYGETPVPGDELQWLLPEVREVLGEPVLKAAVYDLEQAEQEAAAVELLTVILVGVDAVTESGNYRLDDTYTVRGALEVAELLTDHFLRALHHRLFERIWAWAGTYRAVELNIGVPPPMVAVDIRASLESLRYRWEHTSDWTGRQLGIAAHAELVRIHPFTDGNGRTTRLLADLVFAAAQQAHLALTEEPVWEYDWDLDKADYIRLLREYDRHRNPSDLAAFVPVVRLGE